MQFMIHEEHGATNIPEGEVEAHEKLGWKKASTDDWFRMSGKVHIRNETNQKSEYTHRKPGRPRKEVS